jgi:outer membrane receptor protein involved in Fe transport
MMHYLFRIRYCIISLLLYILVIHCKAQDYAVVRGRITDSATGRPLAGANIIADTLRGVISDPQGNYLLLLKPGRGIIMYSFIGYRESVRTVDLAPADTIVIDIRMVTDITMLDQIVVTASKYEQKLSDVTVSIDVLKPRMIELTNPTSMEMIINQMPGIDILDGQASIRGGSGYSFGAGSRVLVLVDDLSILSADVSDVKWEYMPVENISQVEIIKGASSVLYGSSALNGVINIRTAYPGSEPQTKIDIFGGTYLNPARKELIWWKRHPSFGGASFLHSATKGNLGFVIGSYIYGDEGYRENETDRRARFNMNLVNRDRKIKGLVYGVNMNTMYQNKIDFLLWQNADSGAYRQNTLAIPRVHGFRLNVDPYLEYSGAKNSKHSIKTRFFMVSNVFKDEPDKDNESEKYFGEYRYHKVFKGNIILNTGLSTTYSDITANLYGNHNSLNTGIYSQFDLRVFSNLKLSGGLRWETYKLDTIFEMSTPLFRAGLNYQPARHTFFRASYGQGYRFPSIAERYTATSISSLNIFPNPDLKTEKGWSAEAGVKQSLEIKGWKGYIDAAAFITGYSNMIEYTFGVYKPDTVEIATFEHVGFKSLNTGNARITGIEMIIAGSGKLLGIPAVLHAGYNYSYPVDLNYKGDGNAGSSKGNILKYRFQHSVKADIELSHKWLSCGLNIIYRSFMVNVDSVFVDPIVGSMILPGYGAYREEHDKGYILCDGRISCELPGNFEVALIMKNIFNKEYIGRPGDIGPPRNVTLKLSWRTARRGTAPMF